MNYGIYIHVPFCRRKCHYCGFYSVPVSDFSGDGSVLKAYTGRLTSELELRLPQFSGDSADTVYFGGGTPSLLDPDPVARIIRSVRNGIFLAGDAEITLEMNPEDAQEDKILGYIDAGVTRLILGFQTSREDFHALIGRSTMLPDSEVLRHFFSSGNAVRGIDVMVGLPGQGPGDVAGDLDLITSYGPQHVSVYCLAVEEKTALGRRFRPDADFGSRQRECMEAAMDYLAGRGYIHYEISNFCLPGFESRHNSKYWTFRPYLGFGPRAHSFFGNGRFYSDMSVEEYLAAEGFDLRSDGRNANDRAVEYIMTGLRMLKGMSIEGLKHNAGFIMSGSLRTRMQSLQSRGLLVIREDGDDTVVSLTREGIFLSDAVIYELVEELL